MSGRRRGLLRLAWLAAVPVLVLLQAAPAWAPHVAQLQVTPVQVRAGEPVTVFGPRGYGHRPVEIRMDSVTAPVLGSFQPDQQFFAQWGPGQVVIPLDARPGNHVLYATQELPDADAHIRGVPARAVIEVVALGGAPAVGASAVTDVAGRPTSLARDDQGVSWGAVGLVALGVAGLAMLVAGGAAAGLRGSSHAKPETEKVST